MDLPTSAPAERNKQPILDVLERYLPARGLVLEIASGTGQHVAHFAAALPALEWQPTEADPAQVAVIAARVREAGLERVRAPLVLDVTAGDWPVTAVDAIVCINMIHIAPWRACEGLLRGAGAVLSTGGRLILYGPYRRNGVHTAASNAAFDARLKARNPEWGVRELETVTEAAGREGFELDEVVAMPANNCVVVFGRR